MEHFKKVLDHQMDLTRKIVALVPEGKGDYAPGAGFMPMGILLRHLGQSPLSMIAILMNRFPSKEEMEVMMKDETRVTPAEAAALFDKHYGELLQVFKGLDPEFYNNGIVHTPFMGDAPCWMVLTAALEHLINHRHQLFTYMKLMGMPVDTGTLYFGMLKAQV